MKSKALILVMMISLSSYSQSKIEGIYRFKPGITTVEVIKELEKELKEKVDEVSDPEKFIMKTGYKLKLYSTKMEYKEAIINLINVNTLPKTKEYSFGYITNSPHDPSHKVYFISTLNISGIQVNKIYLFFRNGILVKLKCDQSEDIDKTLEAKYGKPVIEKKEDSVKCTYKLTGHTVDEKEETFISMWKNENIEATSVLKSYRDSNCKEQFQTYFLLEDVSLSMLYADEEFQAQKQIKDKFDNEKKAKLRTTDF